MSAALAKPPAEVPAEAREAIAHAKLLSQAFRAVAKTVAPAVVSIETAASAPMQTGGVQLPPQVQELLKQHGFALPPGALGGPGVPGRPGGMPAPQRRGQGTGFVVSEDGFIATNNHVVRGAQEFLVRFNDGREAPATLVGTDPETDIAVLRVEVADLTPLAWGDSDAADVGDWVIALGTPFGLADSVTAGIISAKGRQVGLSPLESYLQTDATVNPGNSGGPLVDLDGRVVGINTAIESRSGGSDGISFAIPSAMARTTVEAIIAGSAPSRGFLGVQMQPLDRDLAASFGFSGQGVVVSRVSPDSPAEAAGLQPGDILVRVNGEAATSVPNAQRAIKLCAPGRECPIEFVRDGQAHTTSATLEEFASAMAAAGARGGNGLGGPQRRLAVPGAGGPTGPALAAAQLGLEVAAIDPALAKERGITDLRGVLVTAVAANSAGARAGLRAGDIVRRVGDAVVTDATQFDALAGTALAGGRSARLLVERQGDTRFVLLRGA